jgi:predicted transcriptional regulator
MTERAFLEAAVMDVLWSGDQWLTAGDVQQTIETDRTVAYTTVLTVLSRLWKKGVLRRRREGRAYAYKPKERRVDNAARRMEEILDASRARSLTLSRFLDNLSASERKALRQALEEE